MGMAILRVSRELLRQVLCLPEGTEILDVSPHVYFSTNDFAFKVEHPSLPPVSHAGQPLHAVNPTFTRSEDLDRVAQILRDAGEDEAYIGQVVARLRGQFNGWGI